MSLDKLYFISLQSRGLFPLKCQIPPNKLDEDVIYQEVQEFWHLMISVLVGKIVMFIKQIKFSLYSIEIDLLVCI